MSKEFRPDTICVQAGWKPKKGGAESTADLSEHDI